MTKEYKWWHMRRVRLTRDYLAGIIAGTGVGLMIGFHIPNEAPVSVLELILGLAMIAVGSSMALFYQQKAKIETS